MFVPGCIFLEAHQTEFRMMFKSCYYILYMLFSYVHSLVWVFYDCILHGSSPWNLCLLQLVGMNFIIFRCRQLKLSKMWNLTVISHSTEHFFCSFCFFWELAIVCRTSRFKTLHLFHCESIQNLCLAIVTNVDIIISNILL